MSNHYPSRLTLSLVCTQDTRTNALPAHVSYFHLASETRLWDCGKSGNSLGEVKLPDNVEGAPLAAFDSTGLVFGVSAAMSGGEGYVSFRFHDCRYRNKSSFIPSTTSNSSV